MFPNRSNVVLVKCSHLQQGSVLVIGIFIITVMFLLASALIRVLNDADEQFITEVWGTRALAAANSGADAAMAALFPVDGSPRVCALSSTWTPPSNLVGFSACNNVQLSCVQTDIGSVQHYRITSTATCESGSCSGGATADSRCTRVSRTVEVEARAQ